MSDTAIKNANDFSPAEATRGVVFTPRVDVIENENELLLFADMPGVKEDGVDIRFEKGELTLHGRRTGSASPAAGFLVRESEPGDYFRSFRISEQVNAEKIWAELRHGVLTLHLPKVEKAKPRKIAVKGS
jgi:HSP20 family protein